MRPLSVALRSLGLTVLLGVAPLAAASTNPMEREGDVLPKPRPALSAPAGVTALAGQVMTTDGVPLRNVALRDGGVGTRTNEKGDFLLSGLNPGTSVLTIDGRHAGADGATDYGLYEVQVTAYSGRTTALGYVSYLPKIDHEHDVTIASPTTSEVVVKAAAVPGLELHIPPGAILTDTDGKPVTRIGITPIPLDRTPFPLPRNVEVPLYFTTQPGGATITGVDGNWLGVQVYYPNYRHELPKARGTFYKYEPFQHGWTPYGMGQVSADGRQMVPDQGTRLYDLTGAMYIGNPPPPPVPPDPCDNNQPPDAPPPPWLNQPPTIPAAAIRGDPVDLASGLWIEPFHDLKLNDIRSIDPQRTYNSADFSSRSFGVGMTFAYDMYLYSVQEYQTATLSLPSCEQVHFTRIPNGGSNGFTDAVFVNTVSEVPAFYQSRMVYNSDGWNLTLQDGTVYVFGDVAPLQAIRDRFGDTITLTHSNGQTGEVTQVTSPNGRFINFTYDANSRIIQARDNAGRTVSYTYDASGRMQTSTDADGGVTTYAWDSGNHLYMITDPLGNVVVTNVYDANDRVIQQTEANGGIYSFAYTGGGSGGYAAETDITDPRGTVEKILFNAAGRVTADDRAVGTPQEQDTVYTYDPVTNLLLSTTDALNRTTAYTYDANGNVATVTKLVGTSTPSTSQYTYGIFNQQTSSTDPLGHVRQIAYDGLGVIISRTDTLGNVTTYGYQVEPYLSLSIDPLGNRTTNTYVAGLLATRTDPLGRTWRFGKDAVGRTTSATNAVGQTSLSSYDPVYGIHQQTDPDGNVTVQNLLPNGLVGSVVDARGGKTSYTYDANGRRTSRTDPLGNIEQVTSYDGNGNLLTAIDRDSQLTTSTYDPLNRLSTRTFSDGSVVSYIWDGGNHLIQIQDSSAGTITRTFDGLDNMLSETTAQGTVTYAYDAASRRTSMVVPGQPEVIYSYDSNNRLTQIIQGSASVAIAYDAAGRRTQLTLPNGIVAIYGYDAASALTSIAYANGSSTVGTLTYGYNAIGLIASAGGTLFQSVLPTTLSSASYDADNRLKQRVTPNGGSNFIYDDNGNLLNDGTTSYTWDARDRLLNLSNGASFTYDAIGRRQTSVINASSIAYLYDRDSAVQEQSGGTVLANILAGLGIDERFSRTEAGTTSVFLVDAHGSTVALTDTSGLMQTSYGYDPFGNTTVSGELNDNKYQYTGRENDGSELYYYRARYYSPILGRFVAEDPLGLRESTNRFAYGRNDPIRNRDPKGLLACPCKTKAETDACDHICDIQTDCYCQIKHPTPGDPDFSELQCSIQYGSSCQINCFTHCEPDYPLIPEIPPGSTLGNCPSS